MHLWACAIGLVLVPLILLMILGGVERTDRPAPDIPVLANLSILKTGKARAIRFSTLGALCEALDCQPGDLLAYEPEDPANAPG